MIDRNDIICTGEPEETWGDLIAGFIALGLFVLFVLPAVKISEWLKR